MRTLLATLVALVVVLAAAAPAMASYTGTVNAAGTLVTLNGNGSSDQLVVTGNDFGQLEHSAIGAGFVSPADWDTVMGGVQTVSSIDPDVRVVLEAGDGDDGLTVGSPIVRPFDVKARFIWDGEGGANIARINGMAEPEPRVYLTSDTGIEVEGAARIETDVTMTDALIIVGSNRADTFRVMGTPGLTITFLDALAGNDTVVFPTGLAVGGEVLVRGGEGSDSVLLDDSAATSARHYSIDGGLVQRGSAGRLEIDDTTEGLTVRTGSGDDRVSKSAERGVAIDTGPGADQVITRDTVADNVVCGTESDFVLSDTLDVLGPDCEASDRTLAQGSPAGSGPVPPGASADRTAPKLTLAGLPKKTIKVKQLLKGLKVRVVSNEPAALDAAALGSSSRVSLSRAYNVTLASARSPLAAGTRTLRLKPSKRLVGRARKFSVRVTVTATDASGNRSTRSAIVKVRR